MKIHKLFTLVITGLLPVMAAAQTVTINGQEFTLDPDVPLTIDPATGNVTLSTVEPLPEPPPDSAPTIITPLSLTPTQASQDNGTIDVAATYVTEEAVSCEGRVGSPSFGLNTNWDELDLLLQSPQGQQTFQVDLGNLQATEYTLELRCENSTGSVNSLAQFEVTPGSSDECIGVAPASLTRDTRILAGSATFETLTFASLFGSFPGSVDKRITINRDQYAALQFNTNQINDDSVGAVILSTPAIFPIGPMLMTISECPGDFRPVLSDACRVLVNPFQNTGIFHAVEPFNSFQCDLELNTEYYLNIVPTVEIPGDSNPVWACGRDDDGDPNISASDCSAVAIPQTVN